MRHSGPALETELHDLLGAGRNARIAARYYGFDGRGGGSLQTVGNEIGLTRERVRQIVTASSEWLSTGRPVSRLLDRTIGLLDQGAGHAAPAKLAREREPHRPAADDQNGNFSCSHASIDLDVCSFGKRLPFLQVPGDRSAEILRRRGNGCRSSGDGANREPPPMSQPNTHLNPFVIRLEA